MRQARGLGALWGIVGIVLLLLFAAFRLTPHVVESFQSGLSTFQISIMVAWTCFMVISEGYDGFQKRFAPRVVSRAQYLRKKGTRSELVLAPLFCFGYFKSSPKRLVITYTATTLIILAVFVVSHVSTPWRGIIDAGVIVGLLYGTTALAVLGIKGLMTPKYLTDPVVPNR